MIVVALIAGIVALVTLALTIPAVFSRPRWVREQQKQSQREVDARMEEHGEELKKYGI